MTREHWLSFDESSDGLTGLRWLLICFAVCFAAWHVATNLLINEPPIWQNAIHFGGFAFLGSIIFPAKFFGRSSLTFDATYGLVVALSACWVVAAEPRIYEDTLAITGQAWQFNLIDWLAGSVLIFAAFDFSRRVSGWVIPVLIVVAISYILFLGEYLPGVFRAASLPLDDILFRTIYNDEGLFGILANISSSNIALFMIFGGFLVVSGASDFVIEISKVVAGRIRGGAAFVAVLSSALTGTISGSAVANTASTGVITIPLMKSSGFRGRFAAGIEAAASTGGQLMPPIMGAGAFVMASYTSIPYATIVAVSVIPAFLYFLSVAFVVRIEAVKHRVGEGVDMSISRAKIYAGGLTFVIPLGVMIYLLMAGVTPSYAASGAIGVLIAASWFSWLIGQAIGSRDMQSNVMNIKRVCEACLFGVRSGVLTAILMVSIGVINNAIVTSGIGNGFSLMIAQWSQGSLGIAILLIGLASLVLGMGLPVTAAYIIMAILCAPALAGILADTMIVEQLMVGLTDPAQSALFMLVDSPYVAKVATGMTEQEAWSLVAAIPFEVAMTLRPVLVDVESLTGFLLIAHLIIFWLSQDSNVTPPVCLAAFTAAGIAKSPPMATGFQAWRAAKGLYIVPLLFAYTPLITGSLFEMLQIGVFSLFGIYAINAVIARYAEGPLAFWNWPCLVGGAALCFVPLDLLLNLIGAFLVSLVMLWTHRQNEFFNHPTTED
ncbi:MAG: TRAP transporter fused permease subunit [Oceanospirillales bacterium TMED33]|nr:C4-dicarboxylate ABC transporter permease [Gammaproteobacteria bacterium]RPG22573.1 MAG: TRAP transporter fused permease subunit [Oceanospirillales bacterium TMED33]